MDKGASASQTGPSQVEPVPVSPLRASVPSAGTFIKCGGTCEHDFQGWREFEDGLGGEQFCCKCGLGAMAHTLSLDF